MKVQTTILIDQDLKKDAQASGIKLGNALEEYLRMLLHKGDLKMKFEEKKRFHLDEARKYRDKIKLLDQMLEREEEIKGDMNRRIEKALDIAMKVYENEGGLTDDRIRDIAEQQIVDPIILIDLVKEKFILKKG